MKNYEKYAEEIRSYEGNAFCVDFIIPNILKKVTVLVHVFSVDYYRQCGFLKNMKNQK